MRKITLQVTAAAALAACALAGCSGHHEFWQSSGASIDGSARSASSS
jgi:outer membrane murein-binding lipoprotein Lpp